MPDRSKACLTYGALAGGLWMGKGMGLLLLFISAIIQEAVYYCLDWLDRLVSRVEAALCLYLGL